VVKQSRRRSSWNLWPGLFKFYFLA
jgi:hypothetical protein